MRLGHLLTIIFILALLMGPGPGLLLANRPTDLLGLPVLYVWACAWYVVQVVVVVAAYVWIWSKEEAD